MAQYRNRHREQRLIPGYGDAKLREVFEFREACIRCPLLRPDPAQRDRLADIRANLLERIEEAREHGWLGEVEGLQATLAAADQKLADVETLAARRRTVALGMPDIRKAAGRHMQ